MTLPPVLRDRARGPRRGPSAGTEPAHSAVDATLTVRLTAGKSTYAMGEIIPLELGSSAAGPARTTTSRPA
jgi:hypothetical protein